MREIGITNSTYTVDDAARALLRAMRVAAEPPTLLLMAREAAKALAISEKTLWSLTTPRGTIPAIRVGERSLRYSVRALEEWIDRQPAATAETNGVAHE
jgi:predicted DNA-binding transcriptional regulator AlpA